MINKEIRDKIVAQALSEISFAREHKQGKIINWKTNEDMYYGRKQKTDDSRANLDLARMQEYVHTIMSKIDNPLVFKYTKRKESQLERTKYLNSLRKIDAQKDLWDIKDIAGKKQAIIYGRAIYFYYASSDDGYKAHLDPVDVYDFLIDPNGGGIDIEKADYMGRFGVTKNKKQLEAGVKAKIYLKEEVKTLLEGSGDADSLTQEEQNKQNRTYSQNVTVPTKSIAGSGKYKFWEWLTTYEGERYYLLMQERGGGAIRVEKLEDMFASNLWPVWSWAAFLDMTEFWTPSFCDYTRELFMGQAVSINQMLDNGEAINKPQKVVNVSAIQNLAELKYKKNGLIKVKKDFDVNKAVQFVQTPSIETPIKVFEVLEKLVEKSGGATAGDSGVADNSGDAKVAIYEGNQANSADKYGLLNKTYSFGYDRFALLYEWGVREHLNKRVAVDILGPNGIEVKDITKRDIFRKDETFGVMVEASNAEMALSEQEKSAKMAFLGENGENPVQNPKKAYEIAATTLGFDEETIRQLMDTSEFGDAKIMSEAERDIELLIDGKEIGPNPRANTAYKQRFVDYMQDHKEDMDDDTYNTLVDYVIKLEPVIAENMARQLNEERNRMMLNGVDANINNGESPMPTPEDTPVIG